MIASWMLYALLVSTLLAAAASLLEPVLRLRGRTTRFLWLGAMIAAVALIASAPLRTAPPAALPADLLAAANATDAAAAPSVHPVSLPMQALAAVRGALGNVLHAAAELGTGAASTALGAGWMLLSAAALGLIAVTALRGRRVRRTWPLAQVAGEAVRVAPAAGPAVLGIRRPEVVVPAWLLHAPAEEQRLVVLHEREHIRARDPLLLATGCIALALMPWNPAAWWMLLRLRAAAEVDCDARVLRRGVGRRAYGSLLIDMAVHSPGLYLGSPALAGMPSTLERRLRAMNARLPRHARLRAALLATLGVAALVSACESPLPTSAEVQRMDVAAVEAHAGALQLTAGETTYLVDDRAVTAEEARALPADRIARVDVRKDGATGSVISIYTTESDAALAGTATLSDVTVQAARPAIAGQVDGLTVTRADGAAGTVRVRTRDGAPAPAGLVASTQRFEGLVVVDGRVTDESALRTLSPDDIASVDILKGAAAAARYDDPRAAHGVIQVTTKASGAQPQAAFRAVPDGRATVVRGVRTPATPSTGDAVEARATTLRGTGDMQPARASAGRATEARGTGDVQTTRAGEATTGGGSVNITVAGEPARAP